MYICIFVCARTRTRVHTSMRIHTCLHACAATDPPTYILLFCPMYIPTQLHAYTHEYTRIHTCINTCMHTHMPGRHHPEMDTKPCDEAASIPFRLKCARRRLRKQSSMGPAKSNVAGKAHLSAGNLDWLCEVGRMRGRGSLER